MQTESFNMTFHEMFDAVIQNNENYDTVFFSILEQAKETAQVIQLYLSLFITNICL